MTFVILFVLAVVWAIYLASWLRNRSEHKSVNSISSFNRHLSVLERATPGSSRQPAARTQVPGSFPGYSPVRRNTMSLSTARRRRRDVLFVLVGAAAVTLVLTVIVGGMFLPLQLLADVLIVGYLALLFQSQRRVSGRRSNVIVLGAAAQPQPEPAYLLVSNGSAGY